MKKRAPVLAAAVAAVLSMPVFLGPAASHAESSSTNSPMIPLRAPARFITSGNLDLWPCFSPDGTRVLFSRRSAGGWELLVVSIDGGAPRQLARSPLPVAATRANWSKENRIAFTGTSAHGASAIWLIDADGSNARELHIDGLSNQMFYPSWFPDGEQLAAMDAENLVIQRIDVRKATAAPLTDRRQVLTGMPSVSPDGASVVFAGQRNAGQQYDQSKNSVWLIDASGVARVLESQAAQGRAPTWSPSGTQIAFESTRGSDSGLYAVFVINIDGTGLVQVTERGLNADHPVWSPDGRHLAFSARSSTWSTNRSIGLIETPGP